MLIQHGRSRPDLSQMKQALTLSGSYYNQAGSHVIFRSFWKDCLFGIWQLYRNRGIYIVTVLI